MREPASGIIQNVLSLLTAAFLFMRPAFCAVMPSGADYQITNFAVDNGGGGKMTGGEYSAKGSIGQNSLPPNLGLSSGGEYANRVGFYNPPHFTYQAGLPVVFSMASGDVRVTLPANSVEKEVFDITMNKNPIYEPLSVDPNRIIYANDKKVYNETDWSQLFPNNLSEVAIFDEQDFYSKPLAHRGVMAIRYKDENNDGILDGSNPPVRVNTLNAWILDVSVDSWVQMPGEGADTNSKILTVNFGLPGVYALLGAQDRSVVNVKAYPVPFRPNGPQAGTGQWQTGTEAGGITFDNVPQGGDITIYTLDGRLVKKINIPDNMPIQKVTWNVRTASGERTASGVYIWRVVSGSNSKTGKIMVIW